MDTIEQEKEILIKQKQLVQDQQKNIENLLIEQNELYDLNIIFKNETDYIKKKDLKITIEAKQIEIKQLKKKEQLIIEQQHNQENIKLL